MEDRRRPTSSLPRCAKVVIALAAVFGYLGAGAAVLLGLATGAIKDPVVGVIAGTILGTLAAEYKGVMGYIFGSSEESHDKSQTISRALGSNDTQRTTTTTTTAGLPASEGAAAIPATVTVKTEPAHAATPATPLPVQVVNPSGDPVPVTEVKPEAKG